jgi:hypothetical protein
LGEGWNLARTAVYYEFPYLEVAEGGSDEVYIMLQGTLHAFLKLRNRNLTAVYHDVRQAIESYKGHFAVGKSLLGLITKSFEAMHNLWSFRDVHALLFS